jgi:hypothetical protein
MEPLNGNAIGRQSARRTGAEQTGGTSNGLDPYDAGSRDG